MAGPIGRRGVMFPLEGAGPNKLPWLDADGNPTWTDPTTVGANLYGWEDYNDTSTAGTPVAASADVWTALPNDGAGAFSNIAYSPAGYGPLMDVSTGKIDPTRLPLGTEMLIRNDFTVTPTTNEAVLDFRYTLGGGGGEYTLGLPLGRLDRGAGVAYRFAVRVDKIYMGDLNTRDNPIGLEVRCGADATVVNAGSVITVIGGPV